MLDAPVACTETIFLYYRAKVKFSFMLKPAQSIETTTIGESRVARLPITTNLLSGTVRERP